nr:MAG TPA: hypothetical protein [Bacteriophage sp.]
MCIILSSVYVHYTYCTINPSYMCNILSFLHLVYVQYKCYYIYKLRKRKTRRINT